MHQSQFCLFLTIRDKKDNGELKRLPPGRSVIIINFLNNFFGLRLYRISDRRRVYVIRVCIVMYDVYDKYCILKKRSKKKKIRRSYFYRFIYSSYCHHIKIQCIFIRSNKNIKTIISLVAILNFLGGCIISSSSKFITVACKLNSYSLLISLKAI